MKNLYVTTSTVNNGDSFDIAVTWDKAEALQAADLEYHHLTPAEREKTSIGVNVYTVPDPAIDISAKECYHQLLEDDDDVLNNCDFIEYK